MNTCDPFFYILYKREDLAITFGHCIWNVCFIRSPSCSLYIIKN